MAATLHLVPDPLLPGPPDARAGTEGGAGAKRAFFGAAPVDAVNMAAATAWLVKELCQHAATPTRRARQVMGPNAFLVSLAATDRTFAQALRQASLCVPDGMSVVWGGRLLGVDMPERVPGGEFMENMCALCAAHGLSVYFLGGMPGAADMAAQVLADRYPGLRIAGTDCPAPGFEHDPEKNEAVRARIIAARPSLLCVALGAPKQEIWMMDECDSLPIGAAISVGAAFDTQAGLRKRAPAWTHNLGAEWLYRFAMEPRRLWKRYLLGNLAFAWITARAWIAGPPGQAASAAFHTQRTSPQVTGRHEAQAPAASPDPAKLAAAVRREDPAQPGGPSAGS